MKKMIKNIFILLIISLPCYAGFSDREYIEIIQGNLNAFQDAYIDRDLEDARFHLHRAQMRLAELEKISPKKNFSLNRTYQLMKLIYDKSLEDSEFYQIILMTLKNGIDKSL